MSERLSHKLRKLVRERQEYRCALCGAHHPPGDKAGCISVHHKTPFSRGGGSEPSNLIGLCRGGEDCNNCHDHVDYLTLEHNIPYEQILEEGVEYYLTLYPKEQHFEAKRAPIEWMNGED